MQTAKLYKLKVLMRGNAVNLVHSRQTIKMNCRLYAINL
jgi:hypothetical protein